MAIVHLFVMVVFQGIVWVLMATPARNSAATMLWIHQCSNAMMAILNQGMVVHQVVQYRQVSAAICRQSTLQTSILIVSTHPPSHSHNCGSASTKATTH